MDNRRIILFVVTMTVLVALLLAALYNGLKPIHNLNEKVYNQKAIISSVNPEYAQACTEAVETFFSKENMEMTAINAEGKPIGETEIKAAGYSSGSIIDIDMAKEKKKPQADRIYPVYKFKDAGKTYYIASVRGKGLWDDIWGSIAFQEDLNTIAGVSFDHRAETPGLGAEIKDNAAFKNKYVGTQILDQDGNFVSVQTVKGGVKDKLHQVDAISGATITGDGVDAMLESDLPVYVSYFKSLK